MLYTEYRPQRFQDILHATAMSQALTRALLKNDLSHALFFYGPRGTGKTTTARLIAKALNCQNLQLFEKGHPDHTHIFVEPCGVCPSCLAVQEGNHLDVIEIDAASHRGIENIRELRDNVKLSPAMGARKVYIIDEVHMLTTEASNALLKTLEEPPAHAFFILCTTNPEKVLGTIQSRCQKFQFTRPPIADIVQKLRSIVDDKKVELTDEELRKIAVMAKGAFRDAETILEQVMHHDQHAVDQLFEKESRYFDFITALHAEEYADAVGIVHQAFANGASVEVWTEKFVEYVRLLLMRKIGVPMEGDDALSTQEQEFLNTISLEFLKQCAERFTQALGEFRVAIIATLPLELAIVDVGGYSAQPRTSTTRQAPDGPAQRPQVKETLQKEAKESVSTKSESSHDDDRQNAMNSLPPQEKKETPKEKSPEKKAEKIENEEKAEKEEKGVSKTPQELPHVDFPFDAFIEILKPKNHSIHLMLRNCDLLSFDGRVLHFQAYYSFHQERIMSYKIRQIIEEAAEALVGNTVKVTCSLSDKKPNAKRLTDKNVIAPKSPTASASTSPDDLADTFTKVFGDDVLGTNV